MLEGSAFIQDEKKLLKDVVWVILRTLFWAGSKTP